MDPFEIYTDDDIWSALNDVELKHIASEQHGLQRPVLSNGSNFSVGEKQLLCLARAILQKSKILIADEATGNMSLRYSPKLIDSSFSNIQIYLFIQPPSADQIIQQKIREKFVDCTVLTIAHRLNTIIDSDRILVLGNGEILEFASPAELLESKGVFYGMISSLGKNEADKLIKLAKSKKE